MAKLSLPDGAKIVDGSIRFQAADDPDETINQLRGKPFNDDECEGVREFLVGNLSLKETVTKHLSRFQNEEETTRLLVRVWMLTKFGARFSSVVDQLSKSVEAEHEDFTVVFMKLYQQLEDYRKRSTELNIRRPPAVERIQLNIEESGGRRVYSFDLESQSKPVEHAATDDRKDSVLRRHIEQFRRMTDVPALRKSVTAIEEFLLGRKSLQNSVTSMAAMPSGSSSAVSETAEEREVNAISSLMAAWVAVAFDLTWRELNEYVRWLLRRGVPPLEELFYGLVGRFDSVANLEEEYKLHHSTIVSLMQYAMAQLQPAENEKGDLSNISWKRFDGDSVPVEQRPEVAEKLMQALQDSDSS